MNATTKTRILKRIHTMQPSRRKVRNVKWQKDATIWPRTFVNRSHYVPKHEKKVDNLRQYSDTTSFSNRSHCSALDSTLCYG